MIVSGKEAVTNIKSGDTVYIHDVAAPPQFLIQTLVENASLYKGVCIYHMHTEGAAPYADATYKDNFNINVFFVGKNVREAVQSGRANYIPVFLSEIPLLFKKKIIELDVALVQVSPPDKHGYCSLGISVSTARAAVDTAKIVIAQVNSNMPRTHGNSLVHINDIDFMVYHDEPILEKPSSILTDQLENIGKYVASLVEDRATLQMGIGNIPDAVLPNLLNYKDLGVHTEIFSDGILPLIEKGIITGKYKMLNQGKIVTSFIMGTRKLYDFVDDNPLINVLDSSYVNSTHIIRKNPKVIAVNSAIEVDLTGQVCSDTIGKNIYSGVGGQMDFMRGASLSDGGKAIIALPSVIKNGDSRIVVNLKEGAGVVTTRAHVHYVVTEWGVAHLYGKNLKERTKAMIDIAHPMHREQLEKAALYK